MAGIKNIVTEGFGVRGQVDLIDFQSMPDGLFKYLLNYLDHGVKKLTSIPLTSKQASSVAFALLTIFTKQGPPSILQSNNGGEFSDHAHNYVGRCMVLDDEFIDLVIRKVKNLWPECMMVRGSPRHSESNGGIERVNQTVQRKLGGVDEDQQLEQLGDRLQDCHMENLHAGSPNHQGHTVPPDIRSATSCKYFKLTCLC